MKDGAVQIGSEETLDYIICSTGNPKDTHTYMINQFIGRPSSLPDTNMLTYPVWSTWVKYGKNLTQSLVLEFAKEIKAQGFTWSHIEMDDSYTTNDGDHEFDTARFPDPELMLSTLKSMGFNVTSWVHPFVNYDTKSFKVSFLPTS